jgi:ABC-type glycerol-3-phosphate transport system permease component
MQTKASQRWLDWAIIAVMGVLGFFMLLPFAWLFSMSFRTVKDAYQMPPSFLPPNLDLDNYRAVLNSSIPFLQIYANSVEVAVLVTIGQLVTCTLAAFAFGLCAAVKRFSDVQPTDWQAGRASPSRGGSSTLTLWRAWRRRDCHRPPSFRRSR